MCFCFLLSLTLLLLSESLQLCAVLSRFLSLGELLLCFPFSLLHSLSPLCCPRLLQQKCAGRKVTLGNSPSEILGSWKVVAEFPLTSAWPGFHPLALKCSVLLRASTSVSSAFLQALMIASAARAERMVSWGHWPGNEFLGCQVLH